MNQLEYVPGIGGASVQMDGPSSFVGIAEEMRSREWDYDLGYRDLITATRPARKVDVTFNADYATADYLRRVADADVMARTPGTFVAQKEWKQRGYILASDVDDIHYGRLSTSLKIALLDGAWWRLVKRSFVPEITTPEYRSATGETVTASGASGAPLHALTVDGKAVQNGTPTPSSPVPVQVVAPINYLTGCDGESTGSYPFDHRYNSNPLVLPSVIPAGTIVVFSFDTVNNISTNFGIILVYADDSSKSIYTATDGTVGRKSKQITLEKDMKACGFYSVNASLIVANLQLEIGSTATPYIKAGCLGLKVSSTITPIDLQGNVLASLPDGTKDVLMVDSTGAVTLEKRVADVILNDSLLWSLNAYSGDVNKVFALSGTQYNEQVPGIYTAARLTVNQTLSTHFVANSVNSAVISNVPGIAIRNETANNILWVTVPVAIASNVDDFKSWLSSNQVHLYYPLATPQTIDLGTIDMPAIPLDAQISVTAAVTPTITAEWQISRDAYLDYPHNYPYDFQKTSSTADVTPSVLTPSDVYLAVFGPAVNPYVIVGGNRYQVNVTVPSGGYLVVDGRDKTINLTLADGTVQNVFSSGVRGGGAGGGSYIFEKVPAGTREVTYDGSFGFDLGWYEEEGEPPWSLS